MGLKVAIRAAETNDPETIASHRTRLFLEPRTNPGDDGTALFEALVPYLHQALTTAANTGAGWPLWWADMCWVGGHATALDDPTLGCSGRARGALDELAARFR